MISMIVDMFKDGWIGITLGVILVGCILAIAGLICWGVFIAVDSWFQPVHSKPATVISKEFVPAHTTTIMVYNPATKTSLPQVQHHPDAWHASVRFVKGFQGSCCISRGQYNDIEARDVVDADFKVGRISKGCYVQDIHVRK